jgi:hypothetical protein
MGKSGVKAGGETQNSFFKVKTYSISEIMDAGGATAFANQVGKKPQNITARLKALPREAFLTNEEAKSALEALQHHK